MALGAGISGSGISRSLRLASRYLLSEQQSSSATADGPHAALRDPYAMQLVSHLPDGFSALEMQTSHAEVNPHVNGARGRSGSRSSKPV